MDQGYTYIKDIVFYETFSLVARLEATGLLLCLSSLLWFKLYQMDLKSVFLNRYLNDEIYFGQPKGFVYPCLQTHKGSLWPQTSS